VLRQLAAIVGVLLLAMPLGAVAQASSQDGLVMTRTGQLPILITVPHGGSAVIPDVLPRTRGIRGTDAATIELAEALARHLTATLGAQPYLVVARFHRKYIDANRAEGEAFESPQARPAYDAYHRHIRQFIAQIREHFPGGALLLDVHGQAEDPDVVHRGTRNGGTVVALLRKHGPEALSGPRSIFGVVQSKGYQVFPPANTSVGNPPEDRRYNGGYTVYTYGSRTPGGLDAIQIEVGRTFRTDPVFIAALSEGVATFYRAYLEQPHERKR
jgi:N-formylglutamate amidohydrolase